MSSSVAAAAPLILSIYQPSLQVLTVFLLLMQNPHIWCNAETLPSASSRTVSVTLELSCFTEREAHHPDLAAALVDALMVACYASNDCLPFAERISRDGNCAVTAQGAARCVMASVRGGTHDDGSGSSSTTTTGYLWHSIISRLLRGTYRKRLASGSDDMEWCVPALAASASAPLVEVLVATLIMVTSDEDLTRGGEGRALLLSGRGVGGAQGREESRPDPWYWSAIPPSDSNAGDGDENGGDWHRTVLGRMGSLVVIDNGQVCVGSSDITGSAAFHVATVALGLVIVMWLVGQVRHLDDVVKAESAMLLAARQRRHHTK
jgi:hypothetical protein